MALPSSGPLSLADIQTEFGGSNPIGLSEYYAGGSRVPSGTTGTYGAVPSSGAISILNFYGTSALPPLVGQTSPSSVSATSSASQNMTTGSTTASIVSGGTGPYTYSWSVSDVVNMAGCTADSSSSASTTFSCTGVAGDGASAGTATGFCVITDTSDSRTVTVSVGITATFTGTPP